VHLLVDATKAWAWGTWTSEACSLVGLTHWQVSGKWHCPHPSGYNDVSPTSYITSIILHMHCNIVLLQQGRVESATLCSLSLHHWQSLTWLCWCWWSFPPRHLNRSALSVPWVYQRRFHKSWQAQCGSWNNVSRFLSPPQDFVISEVPPQQRLAWGIYSVYHLLVALRCWRATALAQVWRAICDLPVSLPCHRHMCAQLQLKHLLIATGRALRMSMFFLSGRKWLQLIASALFCRSGAGESIVYLKNS
jgi:hypothetical protein